jgi:glucosamine-6-phosphate deaminase
VDSTKGFDFSVATFLPFRDQQACAAARRITREEVVRHANPDFHIRVIEKAIDFYQAFAEDLVGTIRSALEAGEELVLILPVGPTPQYSIACDLINALEISLGHVHTFNMDEYADESGETPGADWEGSFQHAMWANFFGKIREDLRPPEHQIHFPTKRVINDYSRMVADLGGADVCYGGIGWSGHIAFWEPHLAAEFSGDGAAFRAAGARLVELHPMTVMQNALHSFGGDWSGVPPKANTIGPREILTAQRRSFWLDGDLGGGVSWQRFIARLVAHGPVSEWVPGSLLQESGADFVLMGGVADDLTISHK